MAKVNEYILVRPNGVCEIAKSNGPICRQQSRQELGGPVESFNPQLGAEFTAQINEHPDPQKLELNTLFEGIRGNILIGRAHGAEMWGLSAAQREQLLLKLQSR